MSGKSYYFDYAAATPIAPVVLKSMQPYFSERFYNPSAQYMLARSVANELASARAELANTLGVRSSEIIFTAGGTEANNLAIQGVMERFPNCNIVISAIEHDSVRQAAAQYKNKQVEVDNKGILSLRALEHVVDDNTVLISVMQANNEIGTIQPINEIVKLVKNIRVARKKQGNGTPLYLHTDASQSGNYLRLQPKTLGIDMMTINGGKLYGPKQSGMLFVRAGVDIRPIILGGGQELGRRNGTENVAGSIGFCKSVVLAQSMANSEVVRLRELQDYFERTLQATLPRVVINGHSRKRLPNNLHITLSGIDNEQAMILLDEHGVQVAVGSACSASHDEPSHVLKAIGLSDEAARSSLRFSMGRDTTKQDIEYVIQKLTEICEALT